MQIKAETKRRVRMFTLKTEKDKETVKLLVKSGKDYSIGVLSVKEAEELIKNGDVSESDNEDYPICVNGKYLLPGKKVSETKKTSKEKQSTADKTEDKASD